MSPITQPIYYHAKIFGVGTWNSTTQTSLSNSWYILYQFSFMYLWIFSKWSYFNTQFNMGEFASLSALSLACILWNFSDLKRNFSINSRTSASKKLPQFSLFCFFIKKIALWQTSRHIQWSTKENEIWSCIKLDEHAISVKLSESYYVYENTLRSMGRQSVKCSKNDSIEFHLGFLCNS